MQQSPVVRLMVASLGEISDDRRLQSTPITLGDKCLCRFWQCSRASETMCQKGHTVLFQDCPKTHTHTYNDKQKKAKQEIITTLNKLRRARFYFYFWLIWIGAEFRRMKLEIQENGAGSSLESSILTNWHHSGYYKKTQMTALHYNCVQKRGWDQRKANTLCAILCSPHLHCVHLLSQQAIPNRQRQQQCQWQFQWQQSSGGQCRQCGQQTAASTRQCIERGHCPREHRPVRRRGRRRGWRPRVQSGGTANPNSRKSRRQRALWRVRRRDAYAGQHARQVSQLR